MLTNSSWAWGLPWRVTDVLCDTPLDKPDFPFPTRYQKYGAVQQFSVLPCTGDLIIFSVVVQL